MAGAGYKLFNTGDVLTAAQVNTYLMEQTIMVFADSTARTTALSGVLAEGMVSYLKSTDVVEIYNGSAWVSLDDPNAIQNSIVDAKGDIITATADNVPARLAVGGTNGHVLTVDSSTSTGLKWAAAGGVTGWTSFTPTWTNLTVGNGTVVAAYRDNGDMIDCQIKLTWGSTTSISGSVNIALPVTGHSSIVELILPCGQLHDSGSYYFIGALWFFNASTVRLFRLDCNSLTDLQGANVSATAPATWTTNDVFNFSFSYRKA